jgi:tRNA(Ile2) C34 agmatinyltransferase TiaS
MLGACRFQGGILRQTDPPAGSTRRKGVVLSTEETRHEGICPHCRKGFESELLGKPSDRHRGFKCPHCRLFVPYERRNPEVRTGPTGAATI